ncbi:hypothetical protein UFOVP1619_9 [uncultured Caudovirales phage]|uniref:Uncharacterized protein n=1 Tax=uncultured Caudovirales phage TaxID=2100421 RepID=A0A6J5SV44_9CAUD|nr:hypothetical protein UFOVP1619_9 [uncultured Caudovirales phage]
MSIKVGDWVAFQVGDEDRDFVAPGNCGVWLPKKSITPIPPPDPHAVLKEEVVQAAISLTKNAAVFGYDLPSCKKDVVDAVSALLAAQRPPSKNADMGDVFRGTQAQLADELRKIADDAVNQMVHSDFQAGRTSGKGSAYAFAAILVRNAIITEPKRKEPPMSLREDIEHAINCNSAENGSNTPDYILAQFLTDCLAAYDVVTEAPNAN